MRIGRSSLSPAPSARLKRRLLEGAVDDNLRAIRNQPRGRLHRRPPLAAKLVAAAGLAALAGGGSWLLHERTPAPPAELAASPPAAELPFAEPLDEHGAELGLPAAGGGPARIASRVFPLAVRRVMIDPGHGGGDVGTRTPTGLLEKELTLDIARRLAARLAEAGIEAELTRDEDARVSLRERARLANERRADLFLSIHVNWLEDGRANRGIETYYLGPSDDPFITELASAENRESGYSIADVRRLLDSIYADLRQEQSRKLAAAVQRSLVRSIRELAPEIADRGVKSAPFLVLVATEMPAILAEVASLSSAEEALLLAQESHRERIAVALSDGIRAYSHSVARLSTPVEAR
jgi:N-acetylmuramoyl-L-alanine amidase